MTRIPINPELFTWARQRAGLDTLASGAAEFRSGIRTGTRE